VSLGELGKAAAALVQSAAASFCNATFRIIEELHPPAPAERPIPASVLNARPAPIQVSRDTLVGVLRRMRSGVAAGVSGLTNDHLRCLLPTETDGDLAALDPLLVFVNQVLTGEVDDETADWLCASKLVVLLKPDGAGGFKKRACGALDLRPIAMPESLYRLVSLCALAEVKQTVTDALARVQQLCVGVSSACEGIAAAVRLYLTELEAPDADIEGAAWRTWRAVLSVDASNAFNTVSRAAVLEAVLKHVPGLLPFARFSYARDSRLVYVNSEYQGAPGEELFRTFFSRTGVRQGDPLGPALFALAMVEALERVQAQHPDTDVCAFADDGIALIEANDRAGLVTKAAAVFKSLGDEFRKEGVELNTKTKLLCLCDSAVGTDAGVTGVDKLSLLGVPTASSVEALVELALKRLAQAFDQLDALPLLPFSEAMLILRFCVGVRANYLMDQLPTEAQRLVAAKWDPAVERCLTRMFEGQHPSPRVFLYGPGGLGIARQAQQGDLSRVCGWARAAAVVEEYLPKQKRQVQLTAASKHPVHAEVRAAYARLPEEARKQRGAGEDAYNPLNVYESPRAAAAAAAAGVAGATGTAAGAGAATRATPRTTNTSRTKSRSSSSATPLFNPLKAAVDVLCKAVHKAQRVEVFDSLTGVGRLLFELAGAKGARAWADATPRFLYHKMASTHSRVAHSLWLGMPIAELEGRADPTGRSLLRAQPPALRHSAVLQAYADAMLLCGGAVYKEVPHLFCPWATSRVEPKLRTAELGEQRRMDLVLVAHLSGIMADPTVVDGASQGDVDARGRNEKADRAVTAAEGVKRAYYGPDLPAGFDFYPAAHDTLSGCGKGALALQRRLAVMAAQHANNGAPPSQHLIDLKAKDVLQRVSVAVMRACADSVCKQFAKSPHVALTPAHRYGWSARATPPRGENGSAF
jgi:hypothetical protein